MASAQAQPAVQPAVQPAGDYKLHYTGGEGIIIESQVIDRYFPFFQHRLQLLTLQRLQQRLLVLLVLLTMTLHLHHFIIVMVQPL